MTDPVSRGTVSPVACPPKDLPRDGAEWTASEEAILIDGRAKGWLFKEIAHALRRREGAVRIKAHRLGIAKPWRIRTTPTRHPKNGASA